MPELPVIQSLWIGKCLSEMERLCINSFLLQGHPFHLYTYDQVAGIPAGVETKDASAVISPDLVFKNQNRASYSGFSNLFRYKLLLEKGGYWVDTDLVCLKPFLNSGDYVFAAERKLPEKPEFWTRVLPRFFFPEETFTTEKVCSCIIKVPPGSAIMDFCFREAAKVEPENLKWGQTGPFLLTKAVKKFKLQSHILGPELFCPVDWWDWRQFLDASPNPDQLNNAQAVHLWHEMWRKNNIDLSGQFPETSLYEKFKQNYLSD